MHVLNNTQRKSEFILIMAELKETKNSFRLFSVIQMYDADFKILKALFRKQTLTIKH